jgi:hypothetical protein
VASYSLRDALIELVGPTLTRGQEVAFTEVDGTRLVRWAARAASARGCSPRSS